MRQFKVTDRYTARVTKASSLYMNELRKFDLNTIQEEIELAKNIKKGDQKALKKLVEGNLKFVISVAKKYTLDPILLEDLIQAGNIGLIKAAKKFDETKGFKFISYAVWWIRQEILHYLSKNKIIRLPEQKSSIAYKIYEHELKFISTYERTPNNEELYDFFIKEYPKIKIEYDLFLKIRKADERLSSLDAELSAENEDTLLSLLPSKNEFERIEKKERDQIIIQKLLSNLSNTQRHIIEKHYLQDISIQRIAHELELSVYQVLYMHNSIMRKLRKMKKILTSEKI